MKNLKKKQVEEVYNLFKDVNFVLKIQKEVKSISESRKEDIRRYVRLSRIILNEYDINLDEKDETNPNYIKYKDMFSFIYSVYQYAKKEFYSDVMISSYKFTKEFYEIYSSVVNLYHYHKIFRFEENFENIELKTLNTIKQMYEQLLNKYGDCIKGDLNGSLEYIINDNKVNPSFLVRNDNKENQLTLYINKLYKYLEKTKQNYDSDKIMKISVNSIAVCSLHKKDDNLRDRIFFKLISGDKFTKYFDSYDEGIDFYKNIDNMKFIDI
jgi:hypothetical protein